MIIESCSRCWGSLTKHGPGCDLGQTHCPGCQCNKQLECDHCYCTMVRDNHLWCCKCADIRFSGLRVYQGTVGVSTTTGWHLVDVTYTNT